MDIPLWTFQLAVVIGTVATVYSIRMLWIILHDKH